MKSDRSRVLDLGAGAALVAFGVAAWWPVRRLPFHGDGATFVVDAARDLSASGFWPLVATHSDFAHPPLFVALLAVAWRLFGASRLVAHALVLPALLALLVATYALGKRAGGRASGLVAAAILGAMPVVLEEVGQVYPDLPIAAILAWALVAWTSGRRAVASGLMVAAALMKIPAPLLVPAGLALVTLARPETRRDLRALAWLALPLAVDVAWIAYHRSVTGWALWRPGRVIAAPTGLAEHARALALVFDWLLLAQGRWIVLLAAVAALAYRRGRAPATPPSELAPLLAPLALALLFFAAVGEFGMRYGIAFLPGYLAAAVATARAALPPRTASLWLAAGGAAVVVLAAHAWHPDRPLTTGYAFRPDEDLAYLDLVDVTAQTASWLARRHPEAEIYGAGPEAYALTEPWQGYLDAPLRFAPCKDFAPHPAETQLLVIHPYDPHQPLCRRLVDSTSAQPIHLFQKGEKWMQIYRVPPPPPPPPTPTPTPTPSPSPAPTPAPPTPPSSAP